MPMAYHYRSIQSCLYMYKLSLRTEQEETRTTLMTFWSEAQFLIIHSDKSRLTKRKLKRHVPNIRQRSGAYVAHWLPPVLGATDTALDTFFRSSAGDLWFHPNDLETGSLRLYKTYIYVTYIWFIYFIYHADFSYLYYNIRLYLHKISPVPRVRVNVTTI